MKRIITLIVVTALAFCVIASVSGSESVATTSGAVQTIPKLPVKMQRYTFAPQGFSIKVPSDMTVDKAYAPAFIRISDKDLDIKISKETSPYDDINGYFNAYMYKYVMDPEYRKANNIILNEDKYIKVNGYKTRIVSFRRIPAEGSSITQNEYYHALVITGKKEFYCLFFRTDSLNQNKDRINQILSSFAKVKQAGTETFNLNFSPVLPEWNKETADFYNRLKNNKGVMWGLFYPNTITQDYTRFETIEQKLDYHFPLTLHYLYLGHPFPKKGMEAAYQKGQVVELTMQIMQNVKAGDTISSKHNVNFDVLDGKYDDEIRSFAKDAKAFGHPFIFRLNNEMNSTWIRYSGVALLCDSDLYKKVWQRVYNIFQEEAVDNAIWVFNPNDRDYPPLHWNDQVSYYPGNAYVQVIGLTGYNTGTYFKDLTGETWRTFGQIYDPLCKRYSMFYSRFPWMITEFASSSVGGDKALWIKDMFKQIKKYPNIKAAIWWSYADPDPRPGKQGIMARRYWLDEKDEYVKAFRAGMHGT